MKPKRSIMLTTKCATLFLVAISVFSFCQPHTIVDLSHGLVNFGVPVVPSITVFRWTGMKQGNRKGILYRLNDFETGEHCGSHVDAPYHADDSGRTIDQIPLERFITTGILINASAETGNNYNYTLPSEKFQEWQSENGPFPDPCIVLIDFGWHRFYWNSELFVGPIGGERQSPGLSKEAAEYLVQTKKVYGVGVDTISVDEGDNFIVHKTLLGNDIYILENLDLSTPLPPTFQLSAFPLKLVNGTGSPARVIAWY